MKKCVKYNEKRKIHQPGKIQKKTLENPMKLGKNPV